MASADKPLIQILLFPVMYMFFYKTNRKQIKH